MTTTSSLPLVHVHHDLRNIDEIYLHEDRKSLRVVRLGRSGSKVFDCAVTDYLTFCRNHTTREEIISAVTKDFGSTATFAGEMGPIHARS